MKPIIFLSLCVLACTETLTAQIDSSLLKRQVSDSSKPALNMDAIYNRPFLSIGKLPVSLGGYMEMNWMHAGTDGLSDGHQFQMRRMTLFVASSISHRIKFLSEIEFEEGGKAISIEFASADLSFHPLFNLRGGIIMNPIGAFNQNHDGPKWEFTDRPISATEMLPATWSNAGFGLFGKTYRKKWMFGYEAYLSGGFDNSIIDNENNKTYLPASKANSERFEETANGKPLFTGKMALRHSQFGELGLSYMGGVYNRFQIDGMRVDQERKLHVFAIDYNTTLPLLKTYVTGEWAWITVDVPETYIQQYGNKQAGGFLDLVQPVLKRPLFGWKDAVINLACRIELVDWNRGQFKETQSNIGDRLWSVMPAISFRPTALTVLRFNYRYQEHRDIHDNEASKTGAFSLGISSYF